MCTFTYRLTQTLPCRPYHNHSYNLYLEHFSFAVLDIAVNDATATNFTDAISCENSVDKPSQQRLQVLLNTLSNVRRQVPSEQNHVYHALPAISWSSAGLAPDAVDEHASYLNEFRQAAFLAVSRMIESGLSSCVQVGVGRETESLKTVDREAALCLYTEQTERIRESDGDIRASVKVSEYVDKALRRAVLDDTESDGGHRAVLIRGPEGCGKSTAVLRAVDIISSTTASSADELVVIPRLVLGFGKTSFDLVADIILQLASVISRSSPTPVDITTLTQTLPHEFDRLVQNYASVLRQFSDAAAPPGGGKRRLVIAIDGLENIRSSTYSRGGSPSGGSLDWLSVALPSRIHVIASLRTPPETPSGSFNSPGLPAGAKLRVIDIPELDEMSIVGVFNDTFSRLGRRVPTDHTYTTSLTAAARTHPRPLFVALVTEECVMREVTMAPNHKIASLCKLFEKMTSLESVAKQRFKRVEKQYGRYVYVQGVCIACKYPRIVAAGARVTYNVSLQSRATALRNNIETLSSVCCCCNYNFKLT